MYLGSAGCGLAGGESSACADPERCDRICVSAVQVQADRGYDNDAALEVIGLGITLEVGREVLPNIQTWLC